MIKIICDICGEEPQDQDFACDMTVIEILTSLTGKEFSPIQEKKKRMLQICKGCFYKHISKHLKNEKT